jgi:hypothetical protein
MCPLSSFVGILQVLQVTFRESHYYGGFLLSPIEKNYRRTQADLYLACVFLVSSKDKAPTSRIDWISFTTFDGDRLQRQ